MINTPIPTQEVVPRHLGRERGETATVTARSSACASPPRRPRCLEPFLADLVACGLGGVRVGPSPTPDWSERSRRTCPAETWQRGRTLYAANPMSICPESLWTTVKAMLHSVYDQPDARACTASSTGLLD